VHLLVISVFAIITFATGARHFSFTYNIQTSEMLGFHRYAFQIFALLKRLRDLKWLFIADVSDNASIQSSKIKQLARRAQTSYLFRLPTESFSIDNGVLPYLTKAVRHEAKYLQGGPRLRKSGTTNPLPRTSN
jgi:hypothetical protein